MGLASASYFGANAFIPDFLHATGQPGLKDPALAWLNTAQLLASFVVLAFSRRLVGRRAPFIVSAAILLLAFIGELTLRGPLVLACAALLRFAAAAGLGLALPPPPPPAPPRGRPRF